MKGVRHHQVPSGVSLTPEQALSQNSPVLNVAPRIRQGQMYTTLTQLRVGTAGSKVIRQMELDIFSMWSKPLVRGLGEIARG